MKGKFITVDGIDGCGKTSLIDMFMLRHMASPVCSTFQPSNNKYGAAVRNSFVTGERLLAKTEYEYLLRDRHDVLIGVFVKVMSGVTVISDRHYYSMAAYQSYNKEHPTPKDIIQENKMLFDRLVAPDLSIILDLPLYISRRRCKERSGEDSVDSNYELQKHCKHVFDKIKGPGIVHIDASRSLIEVYKDFEKAVMQCING